MPARPGAGHRPRTPLTGPDGSLPAAEPAVPHAGRIGICCSGGGIRSAAFNLGALQTLQREGVLDRAHYLAAVSGGSYIAGAYSVMRERLRAGGAAAGPPPFAEGSPEERHLRNHTRYIAPDGGTAAYAAARLLAGAAVNAVGLWLLLVAAARPLGWLYAATVAKGLRSGGTQVTLAGWAVTLVAALGLAGLTLVVVELLARPGPPWLRQALRTAGASLLVAAAVVAVALLGLPLAMRELRATLAGGGVVNHLADWALTVTGRGGTAAKSGSTLLSQVMAALSGLGVVTAMLGALRAVARRERSRLTSFAALVAVPVALAAGFLALLNDATSAGFGRRELRYWGAAIVVLVLLEAFGDLTNWSMHPFYKRRLSTAYMLERDAGGAREIDYRNRISFASWLPPDKPHLVVCAAANVSDIGVTPPGRNAVSFTFTRSRIGYPGAPPLRTDDLDQRFRSRARDLTVAAAIAISGAAVSPSMGKMTRRSYRFLLALANVRLGVWVPNPAWVSTWREGRRPLAFQPRPHYLLREMLGINRIGAHFLYVTDGGHYENLGLVELLRRGCTTIYCLDASGDHGSTFNTLGQAVELARADLGVDIDIRPDPMRLDADSGYCGTDHVIGHIRFRSDPRVVGHLVYAKTAVTADAPWDVRAYAQHDRAFPYTSTAFQRFDEQRFEAYRALGAFTAGRAAASMAEHCPPPPPQVAAPPAPAPVEVDIG